MCGETEIDIALFVAPTDFGHVYVAQNEELVPCVFELRNIFYAPAVYTLISYSTVNSLMSDCWGNGEIGEESEERGKTFSFFGDSLFEFLDCCDFLSLIVFEEHQSHIVRGIDSLYRGKPMDVPS